MTATAVFILFWAAAPPVSAADFAALSASPGRPATARVTFDRSKAAAGGLIYAVSSASSEDEDAIRMSEAVVATSGGFASRAAVMARAHGVPAIILGRARWLQGPVLSLDEPVFGPIRVFGGASYRAAEGSVNVELKEGDVASVDAARGILRVYPPAEQQRELALAMALRAYGGLKDAQALAQWFAGQPSRELGARLLSELAARAADGSARAEDYAVVRRAVLAACPERSCGLIKPAERRAVSALARETRDSLDDARRALDDAGTARAVANITREAREGFERLKSLARAAGFDSGIEAASDSFAALGRLEERRLKSLRGKATQSAAEAASAAGASSLLSAALPSSVYRRFLRESGIEMGVDEVARDASLGLSRKSDRVRRLILSAKLPAGSQFAGEILSRRPPGEVLLVRGVGASSTVTRPEELLDAVRQAWASYWSPESLGARERSRAPLEPEATVLMEKPESADVSGLALTRDGALGRGRLLVSAVFGEKEGLLSGEASPDQYVVDRKTGREVLPALVGDKREKFVLDARSQSLRKLAVPPGLRLRRCLSVAELEKLARVARALDDHFGCGLQIGFSFAGGRLFILEARPFSPGGVVAPAIP